MFDSANLRHFIILFFILIGIFFVNVKGGGFIANPPSLNLELESLTPPPPGRYPPEGWPNYQRAPYKYRVLFSNIVDGTWRMFFSKDDNVNFYRTFIFWSFFFFFSTIIAFYSYLRMLDFSRIKCFSGCLIFLFSSPVLLAYIYPVHTTADPLAYLLIILGLIFIFKKKDLAVCVISVIAGLCRETTLIIPLVYLLTSSSPLLVRIYLFIIPIISTFFLRFAIGFEKYDPFAGSKHNFEFPVETLLAIFLVFGFLWLPAFSQFFIFRKKIYTMKENWRVILTSAPIILLTTLGTTILLARAREIRISFILFPWVIPLVIIWIYAFIEKINYVKNIGPIALFFAMTLLGPIIFTVFMRQNIAFLSPLIGPYYSPLWLFIISTHLLLATFFLLARMKKSIADNV